MDIYAKEGMAPGTDCETGEKLINPYVKIVDVKHKRGVIVNAATFAPCHGFVITSTDNSMLAKLTRSREPVIEVYGVVSDIAFDFGENCPPSLRAADIGGKVKSKTLMGHLEAETFRRFLPRSYSWIVEGKDIGVIGYV